MHWKIRFGDESLGLRSLSPHLSEIMFIEAVWTNRVSRSVKFLLLLSWPEICDNFMRAFTILTIWSSQLFAYLYQNRHSSLIKSTLRSFVGSEGFQDCLLYTVYKCAKYTPVLWFVRFGPGDRAGLGLMAPQRPVSFFGGGWTGELLDGF